MRITVTDLHKMKTSGDKIAMLTAYDASFAALEDAQGVDVLLVGDSLGMVLQGHDSTLAVSLDDMIYHTRCVARGSQRGLVLADLPFGCYQASPEQAFHSAAALMAAGAQMVKLEGGEPMVRTTQFLSNRGIPVCAHLGLTPQAVHQLGGYRVQGRGDAAAEQLRQDAQAHVAAGASMVLLEAIPAPLAADITAQLQVPTIGIGAGVDCDGQVLVLHDMLDIFPGKKAKFVKNFMQGSVSIAAAIAAYVQAVKSGSYPAIEHSFQ